MKKFYSKIAVGIATLTAWEFMIKPLLKKITNKGNQS